MLRILIIGGSRFIGKHILRMQPKDAEIVVINRGNVENSSYLPENAIHHKIDRNDHQSLKDALSSYERFDIVYDVCCISKKHAEIIVEVLKGRVTRHVHISSGSVYDFNTDKLFYIPVSEDFPYPEITEDIHPYIRDKTQAEQLLLEANEKENFPVTILRPTFVYGPDNYIYREAYFFDRISRERPILIPEKGNGMFDLVHVDDLSAMAIKLGTDPENMVVGKAFNGSRGLLTSGNMLTNMIKHMLGKDSKVIYYPLSLAKELDWPPQVQLFPYVPEGGFGMSSEKIENIGFAHKHSYIQGMQDAYVWWKAQGNKEPDWELEDLLIEYLQAKEEENSDISNIKDRLQAKLETLKNA